MTIYYLNPLNLPVASGGVQKLHDHVEILNNAGIDAAIINPPNFSPWWFPSRARIVRPPVQLRRGDLLVVPEVYGDRLLTLAPGFPRVSINQNAYLTFENVKNIAHHPYNNCPDLLGILTMSQHDLTYLRHTFPDLYVYRAFYAIDPDLFGFAEGPRQKKIAYMPRKRRALADQIVGSLHARGVLDGWTLAPIGGLSHAQVSDILGTSELFLSFSQREGFGLPPAEAMGRGCFVIGYAGWGGNEFFNDRNSRLILEDDLDGFVTAVADWITQKSWSEDAARAESRDLLRTYSRENERDSVLGFFASIAERRTGDGPAAGTITLRDLVVPERNTVQLVADRVRTEVRRVASRIKHGR